MSYELLSMIFELTGCHNIRYIILPIFEGKNLKSSFEEVSDELWASNYDFWTRTVPKYNIIYVFEETVEKSLKSSFGQVSDELCASMIFELTGCQNTRYMFLRIFWREKFKIKFWTGFRWAMSF